MENAGSVPCPSCQSPVSEAARVCPFCRNSLLVDLRAESAIADARCRWQECPPEGLGEAVHLVLLNADSDASRVRVQ
jgi:endogenous inhibitor of DNA gyrase (YacG/DUF329 family)